MHRHPQITHGDSQAGPQLHTRSRRHTLTRAPAAQPLLGEDKQAAGLPVASAHLEARKELGKHFICSRLETHPTRPGNLALAPEWGLCMLPPPSRPGCGYWGGGGGQPHHVPGQASGATQPPSPWATPGPRLESFRLEKPTSPSSPPHLEATSQIQPAEGSQRNQAGPQLALDLQVSPVSGPHMSPGQAAASPTPQGHSLRHQGRHHRMCPYLSVCGSVAGPPVLPRGGGGPP